jgi:NADPH-dependent curcumin reductase CurA
VGRVVGIAGGKAKCDYMRRELGFDAVVDYESEDIAAGFEKFPEALLMLFRGENMGKLLLKVADD